MFHIELISEPTPAAIALAKAYSVIGVSVHRWDPGSLCTPPDNFDELNRIRNAALFLAFPSRKFPAVVASARLTRLRCDPFRFEGPIAVVGGSRESEQVPIHWLTLEGIHNLEWPSLLASLFKLAMNSTRWEVLPSLECRPAWALLSELNVLEHEINNFFNSIGDHISEADGAFAETLRRTITQKPVKGQ